MSVDVKDDMKNIEVAEAETAEENADVQGNETDNKSTELKYTDEDVNRIVSNRLARERNRMKKLFDEEQHESELDEREKKVLMRELKADAKDVLYEMGMPVGLAELLDYTDKESMEKSIETVKTIFNDALAFALKDKLRGTTPRAITHGSSADAAIAEAFRSR